MRRFKKAMGILLSAACCLGMLSGCGSANEETTAKAAEAASESPKSTAESDADLLHCIVGYWGGTCESPIFIAHELGYFEECGLDVELLQITEDTSILMANDELDAYELTPDKFKPMENGLDVTIIDSLHKGCIQGAASKESGISSVADLEGKTVAAAVGGIAQIQISSQMNKLGLDPRKVNWVTYDQSGYFTALENGEIDAFADYDPWAELAIRDYDAVKFYSNTFDEGLKDYLCCFIGLRTTTLNENPEIATRLSKAFKMSCDYLQENPEEAAELIMGKEYISGDAALNAQLISDYTWVAGDYDLLKDSFYEIWHQIYRAGALENITNEDDLNAFIDKMFQQNVSYHGDEE